MAEPVLRLQPRLRIVPVYWREAKQFILDVHRHHLPGGNGRFSVGVEDEDGKLRGVAVMGRTKARMLPHKEVLEVTRVARIWGRRAGIAVTASARATTIGRTSSVTRWC